MKIGIQGWFLSQPYTGIGQHTIGLTRALIKKKQDCIIVVPKKVRVKGIPAKYVHVLKPKWWILHPSLRKWVWERIQAPQFFAQKNPDWEYYPYPCPIPRWCPNYRAMTVHDLISWDDARYRGGEFKRSYHRSARRSIVRVDQVFTVTDAIQKELGLPTATVLPNAVPDLPKALPRSFDENTLIYLGGYDIRKRVPKLLEAFEYVKEKYPKMKLNLVGKAHHSSRYYPALKKTDSVKNLGSLSDKELYVALKSSFAFVHFSDSEGFNIPLLQAMTVGTPAIVMDIPVNREVSGGTAVFMKGSQETELFDKIKLLKKAKKRDSVVKKQKEVAKAYNWSTSAKIFLKSIKHD
jgi:glycosyltransferase involved in cell wall biosynthesis